MNPIYCTTEVLVEMIYHAFTTNVFFFFFFLLLSALPPDTPLSDLGALAAYDLSKLPDAHKSGEDIIRDIQSELLTRFGSEEAAVISEENAQKLMVGVCIAFFIHPSMGIDTNYFYTLCYTLCFIIFRLVVLSRS